MRLLDRYLLFQVLVPFLYCVGGFTAVFVLFDLTDTARTLFGPGGGPLAFLQFYWTQLPYLLMLCLPAALLLSAIFTLGRLSRSNELSAILGAGVGFIRMLAPILLLGVVVSAGATFLSYDWATELDAQKQRILKQVTGQELPSLSMRAHLFRNRQDHRTWFIEDLPLNSNEMRGVEITQQREDGKLTWKIYAGRAIYEPLGKQWRFLDVKLVRYRPEDGIVIQQRHLPAYMTEGWSETAWRLVSSAYRARYLGSTNLQRYLHENADFPDHQLAPFRTYLAYRWAQPWSCFVAILIAAPLGVVRGRRGMFGNLGLALILFFAHVMLTTVFLALGEGARIPPWLAAWGPNLLIGGIGAVLLYWRSGNREWSQFFSRQPEPQPATTPALS